MKTLDYLLETRLIPVIAFFVGASFPLGLAFLTHWDGFTGAGCVLFGLIGLAIGGLIHVAIVSKRNA